MFSPSDYLLLSNEDLAFGLSENIIQSVLMKQSGLCRNVLFGLLDAKRLLVDTDNIFLKRFFLQRD